MHVPAIEYLVWAKRHRRVRYELTDSGVPHAVLADIDARLADVDLEVRGPYGHPRLIEAISDRYDVDPDGVVPVPGASSGLFIVMAMSVRHGDTVMVEHPVYQPVKRVADFLGLRVIRLHRRPETSFQIRAEDVREGLKAGARAVLMTNLHNPSGHQSDPEAVASIATLCASYNATLIVDEVYLDYGHVNRAAPLWTAASLGENVVAINSLTKVYGLGGIRAGWVMMSPRRSRCARRMMDYLSVDLAAPTSSLAIRAFEMIGQLEARTRRFYEAGQPVFREWLAGQSQLRSYENHGAVFECVRLPEGVRAGPLNTMLVREYDTRVVPGEFFDLPDHFRVSFSIPPGDLRTALSNISDAVERMLKRDCKNVREIPVHFAKRRSGKSKVNVKELFDYVRHLKRLADFKYGDYSRLAQFCLVGATGVVVDLVAFGALLRSSLRIEIARAAAILVAMTWNFALNRRLTFSYSRTQGILSQYGRFVASCTAGALISWLVSMLLVHAVLLFERHVFMAAIVGIAAATFANFFLSRHWVFRGLHKGRMGTRF